MKPSSRRKGIVWRQSGKVRHKKGETKILLQIALSSAHNVSTGLFIQQQKIYFNAILNWLFMGDWRKPKRLLVQVNFTSHHLLLCGCTFPPMYMISQTERFKPPTFFYRSTGKQWDYDRGDFIPDISGRFYYIIHLGPPHIFRL